MKSFCNHFKCFGFVFALICLLAVGISGCSSGGTSSVNPPVDGEIVVSLTDAMGDFVSYTVDVESLTFTRANGAQVSVLPLTTRVDFAQYTELTEFLTASTVPSGMYVKATVTLNYENADINVENEAGDGSVKVAEILDAGGNPITELVVEVQLEDQNSLTVMPGLASHLMLDFDLQASNQVDMTDPLNPILTVEPVLVVDVDRTPPYKLHRIRGLLDAVDEGDSSFSVILRPFRSALSNTHRLFGIRTVLTDSETIFHINQEDALVGATGLEALAALDPLAPVVALGNLRFDPLRFEAWEVYAGTSVPGSEFDVVSGWVTRRAGDTLTVKGASLIRSGSDLVYSDEVTVQVAETTVVTRQISSAVYGKDDVSVGQHIEAFGTFTSIDPENLELDATGGMVEMMITTACGTVVSVDAENADAQLVMDLQSIGKFRISNYDFAGTGEGEDANPEEYEVFTGTLDLTTVTAGAALKVKGFVEPFGAAPPDFAAFELIDVADLRAFLKTNWMPATNAPFTEISTEGLTLNLEGTGNLHYLVRGNVVTDVLDLPDPPSLIPDPDGGLYTVKYDGVVEATVSFATFIENIETLLNDGYRVRMITAFGQFEDASSVLTANTIEVNFAMPL